MQLPVDVQLGGAVKVLDNGMSGAVVYLVKEGTLHVLAFGIEPDHNAAVEWVARTQQKMRETGSTEVQAADAVDREHVVQQVLGIAHGQTH